MKGYVKLRRGLLEHFKIMTASEIKVYTGTLLLANFKSAVVKITLAELADIINIDKKITMDALHRLDKFGYVKYTPAKNQWHTTSIEIINYNGSGKNTTATPTATPTAVPIAVPTANDINSSNNNDLQNPKKSKEVLRREKNINTLSGNPDITIPILYLNEKAKRSFDPKNKANQDLVKARFNEGRTIEDFKKVIDKKVKAWFTDEKMMMYLRPETLFNRSKFESYLNEPEIAPQDEFKNKYQKKGRLL
jgi:uncharacterized phage protein (TIGR02220 family)